MPQSATNASRAACRDAECGLFALARSAEVQTVELKTVPVAPPLDPSADEWEDAPLYEARRKIYPQRVAGTYRRIKWAVLLVTLGIYYLTPFLRWDRGPERAWPGGADRPVELALLLLLHRDLATGDLLPHRPADHCRDDAVSDERARGPHLVRLSVSADGVDRSVPGDRAPHRGRPARTHAARAGGMDRGARSRDSPRNISSG